MPVEHYMMFGTFAEQRHFVYPQDDTYSGVIFNANMVAHAPAGLVGFLVTRTNRLPYLVDPLTHAFQHAPSVVLKTDGVTTKKAIRVVADSYGEPFKSRVGVSAVTPSDFDDSALRKSFVVNCLNFQRNKIKLLVTDHEDWKYFTEDERSQDFAPKALISPYFFLTEYFSREWLQLNIKLAEDALAFRAGDEKIYAEIVVSKGLLLNEEVIDSITKEYECLKLDGYLIWVDDFDEHQVSQAELKGFLRLCRGLRKPSNRPVINLHGGYFSILAAGTLGNQSLTGITHGPEFGESRSVIPVGGGLPFARFYLPILHERVPYRNMLAILSAKGWNKDSDTFHRNVCGCPSCREVLAGNPDNFSKYGESSPFERKTRSGIVRIDYPTQEARLLCLKHFLQNKVVEFQETMGPKDALVEGLNRGILQLVDVLGYEGVKHLYNWRDVLMADQNL